MNTLAQELNKILENTIIYDLLSDFGKRFYFPKGIVAQSGEAKKHAHRFNATIGMAFQEKRPFILPNIQKLVPELSPSETVAYAPTPGIPELREKWKKEIVRKNPSIDAQHISQPMVVPGLTNGIMQIAELFCQKGDTIIIPDMFWGNYRLIFQERLQTTIKTFPFFTKDLQLDISAFSQALENSPQKACIILNFPNNPTGYSPTREEAEQILEILHSFAKKGKKLLVICDDAYFGLFYEPETYKESLFAQLYQLHENILAVKADGATKEEYVWGFRIGFITIGAKGLTESHYSAFEKKLAGAIRSSVSNSSRTAQSILMKTIGSNESEQAKEHFFTILKERYRKVKEILHDEGYTVSKHQLQNNLQPLPFNSGYFMTFRCNGINAEELRQKLLKNGTGIIAIQDSFIRVAYASVDTEDIQQLFTEIFEAAK